VSVVFIFAGCPPEELLELRRFGYSLASTADCQDVERIDDVETYIRDKFAMIVGSEELAKRLRVGHMSWEEAIDFLRWVHSAGINTYNRV